MILKWLLGHFYFKPEMCKLRLVLFVVISDVCYTFNLRALLLAFNSKYLDYPTYIHQLWILLIIYLRLSTVINPPLPFPQIICRPCSPIWINI